MPPTELPLKDLHLPDTIGWWPPALGWWLLAILLPLALVLIVVLYRRLTRKTAVKTAKMSLLQLKQNSALDEQQKLCELSTLLRRVAISVNPRTQVAGLTGAAWLAFLDQSVNGAPFSTGIGQLLAQAPYQRSAPSAADIAELISLCETWLKTCSKPATKHSLS